ncbi:MAG TPA: hypothetical protein VLK33_19815 [Terriglobales bacterium]|nr:hypothetical protein [Terriglobales bacterium]
MPSHHKIVAAAVLIGGAYNLYYDFQDKNTTLDYVIDGSVFLAGMSLFF